MSPSTDETVEMNEEAVKTVVSDHEERTELYEEDDDMKGGDPSNKKEIST